MSSKKISSKATAATTKKAPTGTKTTGESKANLITACSVSKLYGVQHDPQDGGICHDTIQQWLHHQVEPPY